MIKNKMKKCDPSEFSIHDFLGECKYNGDSRFESTEKSESDQILVNKSNSELYGAITMLLTKDSTKWTTKEVDSGRFHLIFGGDDGRGIPFKRFAQLFKWDYGIVPHCNYFRTHEFLTKLCKLNQLLQQPEYFPRTFCYFPGNEENLDFEKFRQLHESNSKQSKRRSWILKPSFKVDNSASVADQSSNNKKCKSILTSNFDEVEEFLESLESRGTNIPWVIQSEITNTVLFEGKKKIEVGTYVLINHQLTTYLYPYLQVETICPDGSSNKMPTSQFTKWLSSEFTTANSHDLYEDVLLPQIHNIIGDVISKAESKLAVLSHADYTCFQLFEFKFLVDTDLKLWLLRVDPNPKPSAQDIDLLSPDLIDLAIRSAFDEGPGKKRTPRTMQQVNVHSSESFDHSSPKRSSKK